MNIEPIRNFELNKYLGKWYEIARLPASFEKDLVNVTATYSLMNNGKVKVENEGINKDNKKNKKAIGNAKFGAAQNIGYLRVSFFWPFYGDYKILKLDKDYKYALVFSSRKLMWILSREKTMEKGILDQYLSASKEIGIETTKLIYSQE